MSVSVFGDSISTFEGFVPFENKVYYEGDMMVQTGVCNVADTWWMRVISARGEHLLANASYSGSLVSGDAFPAGSSLERAGQILGAAGERPNTVLVYMGINDYGEGVVPDEFARAYERLLDNLAQVAPQAHVDCMTLLPGRSADHDVDFFRAKYKGDRLEDYNEAIRAACSTYGAQLVDVAAHGAPFDTLDGTHPTELGMRQLANAYLKALDSVTMRPN